MLGSPWTDEEVERIYRAYTKCGKDWKKAMCYIAAFTIWKYEPVTLLTCFLMHLRWNCCSVSTLLF
ncbi:putative Homeobox-like domain superfamily protein [Helianthus anomalus]